MKDDFADFTVIKGNIKCKVKLDRFSEQYKKAQQYLDTQALEDTLRFMPFRTGDLLSRTIQASMPGSGEIIFPGPSSRYLYYGMLMVSPTTGSPWALAGETKILTDRELNFDKSANPQAQPFWFEGSKAANKKEWISGVKKLAGGGKRG